MSVPVSVLAIDPGTEYLGWAVGRLPLRSTMPDPMPFSPQHIDAFGLIKAKHSRHSYKLRCLEIRMQLLRTLQEWPCVELVSEIPATWQTGRGAKSASSGSVMKLAFGAGMYIGSLVTAWDFQRIDAVEPADWKGQVPKPVVYKRLLDRRLFRANEIPYNEIGWNISDAIGILAWYCDVGRNKGGNDAV